MQPNNRYIVQIVEKSFQEEPKRIIQFCRVLSLSIILFEKSDVDHVSWVSHLMLFPNDKNQIRFENDQYTPVYQVRMEKT